MFTRHYGAFVHERFSDLISSATPFGSLELKAELSLSDCLPSVRLSVCLLTYRTSRNTEKT